MLLHFVVASSFTYIDQHLHLIFMYPSDLLAFHAHAQLHPQVKASLLQPSVHYDSAATLVTRTTVTARRTDKKSVGWVHALRESKTKEINITHSSDLQKAFHFTHREMSCKWTWEQQRKKRVWREEACCLTFKAPQLIGNWENSIKAQD